MKVIIAGGRTYKFTMFDFAILHKLHLEMPITEVVCGMAKGADMEAFKWATKRKIPIERYPANWKKYGRSAGPIRNGLMATYGDALIAFPGGRGTANMIKQAQEHNLIIHIIKEPKSTGK